MTKNKLSDLNDEAIRALLDAATAGPWDVALENGCHGIIAAVLPDGANIIAIIGNDRATPERQQMRFANARLIAAAPDLAAEVLQLRERVRGFEAGQEWQPMETAPKDGTWFWGLCGTDAISMVWHPTFNEFVSSWRRMTMAAGYLIDGASEQDHSPTTHHPKWWMRRSLPFEAKMPAPLPAPPKEVE